MTPILLAVCLFAGLMVGKWHMGIKVEGSHPIDASFDEYLLVLLTSDHGSTIRGSTGGLNGGEQRTMEGGHRVPGIFRWPGKIPSGQVSNTTLIGQRHVVSQILIFQGFGPLPARLAGTDVSLASTATANPAFSFSSSAAEVEGPASC